MQTLHTGCSKAEPEILSRHRPPSWGHGMAKFNQLQTQFGDDWCTQFRVIVVTDQPTHPPTHRQDWLQYTARQLVYVSE